MPKLLASLDAETTRLLADVRGERKRPKDTSKEAKTKLDSQPVGTKRKTPKRKKRVKRVTPPPDEPPTAPSRTEVERANIAFTQQASEVHEGADSYIPDVGVRLQHLADERKRLAVIARANAERAVQRAYASTERKARSHRSAGACHELSVASPRLGVSESRRDTHRFRWPFSRPVG